MSRVLKTVGAQVRLLRKARKFTQERLAERSDLDTRLIGDVERGSRNITLGNLEKIAKGLGVPIRELFPPDSRQPEPAKDLLATLALADQTTSELILAVAKLIQQKRTANSA
jgi:transcriptional regulator with XRE-family HTH domain